MIKYDFAQHGDIGILRLISHLGTDKLFSVHKNPDEQFRVSGTAINTLDIKPAIVIGVWDTHVECQDNSGQIWRAKYLNCPKMGDSVILYEYYSVNMETEGKTWFAAPNIIHGAEHLFVNVDVLKAEQIIQQLRISTFTAESKLINGI